MNRPNLRAELASLSIDRSQDGARSRRAMTVLVGVLAGVLLLGGGGALWAYRDRLQPALEIHTDTIRVMTLGQASTVLTATGYLESRMQAAVGAKAPGRIAEIPVEEGVQVKKGDLLAVVEHSDLDAALASQKLAVAQTEAELKEAEDLFAQAERELTRERSLREKSATTQSRLDTAETNFLATRARVSARQAALAAAKARVVEAEEAVRNMYVYAPFEGTVISKDAEVGETIMPGGMGAASGRGSVATLADLSQLEVDTDVKEDYLGQIRRGQPAEVVVDAVPDRRYKGRLREIIPMGDRTRGIVKVKVAVLDPDERLFPELSATVHFLPPDEGTQAGEAKRALFVAEQAIDRRDGQTQVWCVEGDRVRAVSVRTQGEARDGLVVVEGELTGGETVVVEPPAELTADSRVRLLE